MGSLFLFISLAVLVGIVGLLAYYFKSRIAEVESKNLKSLEIIEGMYSQQQQMKHYILGCGLKQPQQQDSSQYDERIKIVLEEDDDESDDDESDDDESDDDESDDESDDDDKTEVKKISVDMSFPIECELDIDEEEPEYIPEDEPEVNIDEQLNQIEEIIVNKLDEAEYNNNDIDFEITDVKTNDKDNYKKMSIAVLKNVLHSRGIITDSAKLNKMKKSEIIDLLLVTSLAQ